MKTEEELQEMYRWIHSIAVETCRANGVEEITERIVWRFSHHMSKTGGTASMPKGVPTIKLSIPIWNAGNIITQKQTVVHEVAHIIMYLTGKGRCAPHGWEWQQIMHIAGRPAKRCHQIKTLDSRLKLRCCNKGRIGKIQYNKLRTGKIQRYRCGCCHSNVIVSTVIPIPQ